MPAYFAPNLSSDEPARNLPVFNRIRPERRWKACKSTQNSSAGMLAFLGDEPPRNSSGWVPCADGLFYLPGRKMPTQAELVRDIRVDGIDYTTSKGVTLTIPIAAASPRDVMFGSAALGEPAHDWVKRAFALFDRLAAKEPITATSPEVLSLVADAIAHVYAVTPEMLNELRWITSADIDPILCCLMGADPKAVQPAGASLPSPAGA